MIYHDILYNNDKHELSKKHMRHLPQLVQQLRIGRKKTSSWRDPMIAPGSPKKMGIEMVKSCAPARFTIKDKKRVPV